MAETLHYSKPSVFRHEFQILRDGEQIGAVNYDGIRHRQADAYLDNGAVHIQQSGLVRSEVKVTQSNSDKVMAVYKEPMLGRTGRLAIGDAEYTFGKVGKKIALKPSYAWKDADGRELITYRRTSVIKSAGEIVVADAASTIDSRRIMIPLGLFIYLNREEDDAHAAGS